jgi:pyochelin synthetase
MNQLQETRDTLDHVQLLGHLRQDGVELWIDEGQLRYRAPKGVMTQQRLELVKLHRELLVEELVRQVDVTVLKPDESAAHEPFALTDLQAAYLVGRREIFGSGGVGCHGYLEYRCRDIDVDRLQAAWRVLIERHSMLRAVFLANGTQVVLPTVPPFQVELEQVGGDFEDAVARRRDRMSHRLYSGLDWPLFGAAVTRGPGQSVMHISFDLLIADFTSFGQLLTELETLYDAPQTELPPLQATFRDYVVAINEQRGHVLAKSAIDVDKQWWLERVPTLPGMPELPLLDAGEPAGPPRFERHKIALPSDAWKRLREAASANSITASTALLAAFSEVIAMWSRSDRFTLALTLLDRQPLHRDINRVIGDFTALDLFSVTHDGTLPFVERAKACQAQLWADLGHRKFSGVEVAREIARQRGFDHARFPIVFTSTLGGDNVEQPEAKWSFTKADYGITQTPQVFLDCQVIGNCGGVVINWDVRTGVFQAGVIEAMAECFQDLLHRLCDEPQAWSANDPVRLPTAQAERRARVNATGAPVTDRLLHEPALAYGAQHPDKVAVISDNLSLTFGELRERAFGVARLLREAGLRPGEYVAVVLPKSIEQIVTVFGVLVAGGAYLPIDTYQPAARRSAILVDASIRLVVTDRPRIEQAWPDGLVVLDVAQASPAADVETLPRAQLTSTAYAIYTSGSTGKPKGAVLSHLAAGNTIDDINERFALSPTDAVLGLAHLGFDLSVYDIFGVLGRGATLVLPLPDRLCDPSYWLDLLTLHHVTVWNSVPAQMQMLVDYLSTGPDRALANDVRLRLIMLSGDWIPTDLPARLWKILPAARIISLGGATEAGIWSIVHPIESDTRGQRSVPYGLPLRNQQMHVLDAALRPRPDFVAGDLYISGLGLADGYIADPQKTARSFIKHPASGVRLYRTGDLGRYRADGEIELLGREDRQVKIRGHRIELTEIEAAATTLPGVQLAIAVVAGSTAATHRLCLLIEAAHGQPVDPERIQAALEGLLPPYMVPAAIKCVPAMPLTSNSKVDRQAVCALFDASEAMPAAAGGNQPMSAMTGTETTIARIFAEVLGKPVVHREDDFMALGGNSLLASRVAAETQRQIDIGGGLNFDQLLVALLTHRTVAAFAGALSPRGQAGSATPLVTSRHHGGPARFVCVGIALDADEEKQSSALLAELAQQASTVSIFLANTQAFMEMDSRVLVDRLVDACYEEIATQFAGHEIVLIGRGGMSLAALELGRRLRESDHQVAAVVAIGCGAGSTSPEAQQWQRAAAKFAVFPYTHVAVVIGAGADTGVDWDDVVLGEVRRFEAGQSAASVISGILQDRSAS